MQPRLRRTIGRSAQTVPLTIRTILTLDEGSAAVGFRTEFDNTARDHRLRAVFPTDLPAGEHLADSVFDVVTRPDVPGPAWTNPSRCQRMQYMVAAGDAGGGYDPAEGPSALTMGPRPGDQYFRSNILEEKLAALQPEMDGRIRIPVKGKEILTIRFESAT